MIRASLAVKAVLALRILERELAPAAETLATAAPMAEAAPGVGATLVRRSTKATKVYLDASAVLLGRESERIQRDSRYMAARLAMLRDAEALGEVELAKIKSADNKADLFTKPLVGASFKSLRAKVLGME